MSNTGENLGLYNALKQPPKEALKEIKGGRLSGKTDINPQWRYKAMTEQLGPCGVGWKYEITRLWNEPAQEQIMAFATVNLYIKTDGEWSEPIPGVGGSMLVGQESKGLHVSDEGYKMAVTDALSVAMKMIGMAGDIYAGLWDGSKYSQPNEAVHTGKPPENNSGRVEDVKKDIRKILDDPEFTGLVKSNTGKVIDLEEKKNKAMEGEPSMTITAWEKRLEKLRFVLAEAKKQKAAVQQPEGTGEALSDEELENELWPETKY